MHAPICTWCFVALPYELAFSSQTAEPLFRSVFLAYKKMVCNRALLVRNQMLVTMRLCSLYHYDAEWPLKAEPCINAEGCVPTAEVIRAALLLLHPTISASCSGPLQWISRSLLGLAPRSEGSSAGTGSKGRAQFREFLDRVQRHRGADILFQTHFFIMVTIWNLAPSIGVSSDTCSLLSSAILSLQAHC